MTHGKLPSVPRLVAIDATGGPDFVPALQAAWERGDAVLPLDPRLPAPARERLLARLGAGLPVTPGDALVVATSGTTGEVKGVVLTHAAVAASAVATSERVAVDSDRDRWLACLPLAHIGGLAVVCRALVTGTPLVVHAGFDAAAVMAAGCSLVSLVPTALRRIDPSRFRAIVLGGTSPPSHLPANVITTYGMTETGSGLVYDGVPLAGADIAVVDGEIRVRGPMLLRCYRSALDGEVADTVPLTADGWFRTGDGGALRPDGRLHVDGRLSDLIISGGENVWPAPVEDALLTHPAIVDVAVAGRADPEWGERVVAFVVVRPGAPLPPLAELRALVKETLPAYCAPRQVVAVDALPRTSIGKVRRRAL